VPRSDHRVGGGAQRRCRRLIILARGAYARGRSRLPPVSACARWILVPRARRANRRPSSHSFFSGVGGPPCPRGINVQLRSHSPLGVEAQFPSALGKNAVFVDIIGDAAAPRGICPAALRSQPSVIPSQPAPRPGTSLSCGRNSRCHRSTRSASHKEDVGRIQVLFAQFGRSRCILAGRLVGRQPLHDVDGLRGSAPAR